MPFFVLTHPHQELMKSTIYGLRWAVLMLSLYWIALFIGTHIPPGPIIRKIGFNDKILHAGAYTGLSFLLAWAIPTRPNRAYNVILAGLICVVYGAIDELLQIPVGRTADWNDFFADVLGVIMGLSTYVLGRQIIILSGWYPFKDSAATPEPYSAD
jgi:VanZ family protein